VRGLKFIALGLLLASVLAVSLNAETIQFNDGRSITGEILPSSANDIGAQVKVGDGQYEKIAWGDLSQPTLKELAQNPKLLQFVEPFVEVQQEERIKRTEVTVKTDYPKLALPPKGSIFGALFSSSVGIFCLLLIYGANIYAAYETATVRAFPPALVCGVAAVAPIIGPIIFVCMKTKMSTEAEPFVPAAAAVDVPVVNPMAGDPAPGQPTSGLHFATAQPEAAAPTLPEAQVFQRGQFTFNRRFIETKFSGFFGVVRRDAEKDMVLHFKTARGEYVANRISRISASDLHVEARHGHATQEIAIPFVEITEIQLKHKDA
jgi:hypothetical protein